MAIIHLLDDDLAVTQACAFLLESLGYEVMCWAEGDVFLAQADLFRTGVVLLDMRMPALDGQAVHEALRQRGSTLAVVFLTGHGDVPMAVEQMKRGAVDFLHMATNNTQQLRADEQRSSEILDRIPAGRWGLPSDLMGPVVFLASSASDYINGYTVAVDGGWLAR